MNPVVHFEMPYEDAARAAEFYKQSFGWKPEQLGPEMGNYVVMTTSEMDEATKAPKRPGMINGGMYKRPAEGAAPSFVIAVEDIQEAMRKIEAAGGKMLGGMTGAVDDIPGVGLYASFLDTEGNRASILQPHTM